MWALKTRFLARYTFLKWGSRFPFLQNFENLQQFFTGEPRAWRPWTCCPHGIFGCKLSFKKMSAGGCLCTLQENPHIWVPTIKVRQPGGTLEVRQGLSLVMMGVLESSQITSTCDRTQYVEKIPRWTVGAERFHIDEDPCDGNSIPRGSSPRTVVSSVDYSVAYIVLDQFIFVSMNGFKHLKINGMLSSYVDQYTHGKLVTRYTAQSRTKRPGAENILASPPRHRRKFNI